LASDSVSKRGLQLVKIRADARNFGGGAARCPSPLTLGLDFRGCVSATRSETGGRVGSSSRSAELSPPVRPTCCRPLRSLSTHWSAFGVTVGATAIAGPWSALYVKLPTVLAPLIRRVDRGSGGLKTPATDKSFAPSD